MQLYGVHDEHTTKDAQVCTDILPSLVEEALEIAHLLQLLHGGREVIYVGVNELLIPKDESAWFSGHSDCTQAAGTCLCNHQAPLRYAGTCIKP